MHGRRPRQRFLFLFSTVGAQACLCIQDSATGRTQSVIRIQLLHPADNQSCQFLIHEVHIGLSKPLQEQQVPAGFLHQRVS